MKNRKIDETPLSLDDVLLGLAVLVLLGGFAFTLIASLVALI